MTCTSNDAREKVRRRMMPYGFEPMAKKPVLAHGHTIGSKPLPPTEEGKEPERI